MIQRATTLKDLHRFQGWKRQLISTLRKEGINVPKTPTKSKCEHKQWLLTGNMQTCRECGFKKPQPGRKEFEVTDEHRQQVVEYIKSQPEGKRGPWGEFAKAVGVSGSNLGVVVRAMLQDGTISEPAGKGSMVYTVVPNNKKAREAAIKLYEEQRQEGDSPKGRAPVSLEERRRAKARKARRKAAA
jgi:hypothetical protein